MTFAAGANDAVRLAIIGLGGIDVAGGVGGRGRQLIAQLREIPTAKIVALCDVDQAVLDHEAKPFKDRGESVVLYSDLRRVFDDKNVDAVVVATPNHWHALATVWACQSGKDVYVEKPFAYTLWEGRQMVAAARKCNRIVQVGTQSRSSTALRQAFEYLHSGQLGAPRYAHALVYRPRTGIGKVTSPTLVPSPVNYDLWCGPAPMTPLQRRQFHYEWHWFWATGNGEIGNNGPHVIDLCRWALKQNQHPSRVISVGGRFAFEDAGETANTQIAMFDFKPVPIICEVRNVTAPGSPHGIGKYRNRDKGILIDCEGGCLVGDATGVTIFDNNERTIKEFSPTSKDGEVETTRPHLENFLAAVRSRKSADLAAEARQGHLTASCCHMANVSYRLGKIAKLEAIRDTIQSSREFCDAFERCREYLLENGVDLGATPAVQGPWLTFDPTQEQFTGQMAAEANALCRREYRAPFVVPSLA